MVVARDPAAAAVLLPAQLSLHSKETELRQAFGEVRRFSVADILNDPHVTDTRMGGTTLDHSDVYSKYVHKSGGRLTSIMFKWNGRSVMLAEDGRLLVYSKFESEEEASRVVRNVIDVLKNLGLI